MSYYNNQFTFVELIRQIYKKKWIVLIVTVFFGMLSFYFSQFVLTEFYSSEVTIFIGKESGVLAEFNILDLQVGEQLIVDYQELIKTKTLRREVVEKANLAMDIESLLERVTVHTVDDSRFMQISVIDQRPQRAALIANTVAEVLIIKAEHVIGAKNIQIVDKAEADYKNSSPNVLRFTLVSTVIGFLFGNLIATVFVLLDVKVNNQEDIEYYLNITFLGQLLKMKSGKVTDSLVVSNGNNNYESELYKLVRINLDFVRTDNSMKTLLFTSSQMSEGKTTTISNLALAFAQTGNRVLLIDSDLRKPKIHKIFNLSNYQGLTNLIASSQSSDEIIKKNVYKNLDIVTSGPKPPNVNELLSSHRMDDFLSDMKGKYDLVLIDSPPLMAVADSLSLARDVDGIVLVVAAKQTRKDDMVKSVRNIEKINIPIVGLVLTKVNIKRKQYYYYE